MTLFSPPSGPVRQRGVSLVEIMVALVAGLVLMAGVGQIYLTNNRSRHVQDAQSQLQESARFAMGLLARSVQEAGYLSCSNSVPLTNFLNIDPATGLHAYAFDFQYEPFGYAADGRLNSVGAIQGADWNGGVQSVAFQTDWIPILDPSVTNPNPGSDVLTVRGPTGNSMTLTAPVAGVAQITARPMKARDIPTLCDIVVVSSCTSASVLQVTEVATVGGGQVRLAHAAGSCTGTTGIAVVPGNVAADLSPNAYQVGDEVIPYGTTSYYIGVGAGGEPALYRRTNSNNPEELAEGVEEMQIRYGEDTDPLPGPFLNPDFTPNRYVTAADVADWRRVVSVRVSLLIRSTEDNLATAPQTYRFDGATKTPGDRRLRYVFTRTIGIRNRLP
jgi:type IV pilus assembly protein PilW